MPEEETPTKKKHRQANTKTAKQKLRRRREDAGLRTIGEDLALADYWQEAELARQLNVTDRTLRRWHALGAGPLRTVYGRAILYKKSTVMEWLLQRQERPRRRA